MAILQNGNEGAVWQRVMGRVLNTVQGIRAIQWSGLNALPKVSFAPYSVEDPGCCHCRPIAGHIDGHSPGDAERYKGAKALLGGCNTHKGCGDGEGRAGLPVWHLHDVPVSVDAEVAYHHLDPRLRIDGPPGL